MIRGKAVSTLSEKMDRPLVIHIINKLGYGWMLEDSDDFLHDVYVDCLKNEKYYDSSYSLGTFIKMRISNMLAERYKSKKAKAKAHAQHDCFDEVFNIGVEDGVDKEILLKQLQPYIGIEMHYWLTNPATSDYSYNGLTGHNLGEHGKYMTYDAIGELLGVGPTAVQKRIKKNRQRLKEMV